jgi:hypothetical protein
VSFAALRSSALLCSVSGQPWSGGFYASENDGKRTLLGPAPLKLAAELQRSVSALRQSVSRRARLWWFSTEVPRTTAEDARRFLEPVLAGAEDDPVGHYAWAVEVEMPNQEWQRAERHLEQAARLSARPELFEPWILAWVENQRGRIAVSKGAKRQAEDHFARAAELLPMPEVVAFGRRQLEPAGGGAP